MKKVSRRQFVKQSLAVVGTGVLSGCATTNAMRTVASVANKCSPGDGGDEFDYIVVGSGAGGGPVAVNLAKAGYKVLLLEAGGANPTRNYDVPAFQGNATEDPNLSWSFYVKHYSELAKQQRDREKYVPGKGILYPRSGTLGGCTAHNAMITLYPDNQDWDDIAAMTGDSSWHHQNMRQYFQRVENMGYARPVVGNPELHGLDGWLSTEQTNPALLAKDEVFARIAAAAATEQGIPGAFSGVTNVFTQKNLLLDPNNWDYINRKTDGIFNIPKATYRGRRNGTRELIQRTKQTHCDYLFIRTNALATKVLMKDGTRQAHGIEYQEGARLYRADMNPADANAGQTRRVYARREVILSGGAFNSPQLLMLSGIGPRQELTKHGIPVVLDLPGVGKNLQDRYEIGVTTQLKKEIALLKNCRFGAQGDPCLAAYDKNPGSSIYSSNGVIIALLKRSSPEKVSPDLAIFATPGKFTGYYPGWSKDATKTDHFTWAVLKGHTKNKAGEVTLKSADPRDTPDINFHYFEEGDDHAGEDLLGLMKGVNIARRMNKTGLIRDMSEGEDFPGVFRDQLVDSVKARAWGHHASCSNKMGVESDNMAVVDHQFKVYGVEGLRIVDASVFPKIPGLFFVVPIYMIAEKASDDIIATARAHTKAG
jgi:choline dehydrogenase